MAYLQTLSDEEKQKQATPGTGGGVIGGDIPQSSGIPNKPAVAPQQGSGFVNLSKYIDANSGVMAGKVRSAGDKAMSDASTAFGAATKPLENADTSGIVHITPQEVWEGLNGNDQALGKTRTAIGQKYQGPTSVDFDPNAATQGASDLTSNVDGKALNTLLGKDQSGYTQGMRGLDTALMTADPEVADAQRQIGSKLSDFISGANKKKSDLGIKAGNIESAYDAARSGASGYQADLGALLGKESTSGRLEEILGGNKQRGAAYVPPPEGVATGSIANPPPMAGMPPQTPAQSSVSQRLNQGDEFGRISDFIDNGQRKPGQLKSNSLEKKKPLKKQVGYGGAY